MGLDKENVGVQKQGTADDLEEDDVSRASILYQQTKQQVTHGQAVELSFTITSKFMGGLKFFG
jgi:hypothetical protein